jgi:hypothetical protein
VVQYVPAKREVQAQLHAAGAPLTEPRPLQRTAELHTEHVG